MKVGKKVILKIEIEEKDIKCEFPFEIYRIEDDNMVYLKSKIPYSTLRMLIDRNLLKEDL